MLNLFPNLLTYGFFAPTLLRLVAAGVFVYLTYVHLQRREEIGTTRFMLIGAGAWTVWVLVFVEAIIAIGLFLGYYTQVAALLGLLMALKHFVWAKRYPRVFFLNRIDYVLLAVVCLSLLLTGAGALAMDLPL